MQANISVIIPVYNRAALLPRVLKPLLAAKEQIREVIVVDDGSTDQTVAVAESLGARVIKSQRNRNANLCRNRGAQAATGELLLFLDSDVILQPQSLSFLQKRFADRSIDGLVGVYSARHENKNIASQYKNMWIRYSFLISEAKVDWIFGAVSAIRRKVFIKIEGGEL